MSTELVNQDLPKRAFMRAVEITARAQGLPAEQVLRPEGRKARGARQLAAYVASTACGVCTQHLAREAGVWRTAFKEGFARIEDRRDDPRFDARVSRLERQVRAAVIGQREIAA